MQGMKRDNTLSTESEDSRRFNIRLRICFSKLSLFHGCSKRKRVHPELDAAKFLPVVLVLGIFHSGKSTLLEVMQGKSPDCKRTLGVKPIFISHNESTTVKFIDIGGNKQMQNIWHHQYHASHAIIYLVDSSAPNEKHKESVSVARNALGHRFLQGKPVLVICNKMDGPEYRSPQVISADMDLRDVEDSKVKVVEACIHPSRSDHNGKPDPVIKSSIEWLIDTMIGDFHAINERVIHNGKLVEEQKEKKREAKERRLLSLALCKAFGLEGEAVSADLFDVVDGEDFLAHEVGFKDRHQLPSLATEICSLLRYQRLALLIVATKLNRGKREGSNNLDWDGVLEIVKSVRDELELSS